MSLAIALALAIREFLSRPIPFGWVDVLKQSDGQNWNLIGHRLHIANIGRRHFIVEGLGELTENGEGISGIGGEFTWLPTKTRKATHRVRFRSPPANSSLT